jgi:hypothetical protein
MPARIEIQLLHQSQPTNELKRTQTQEPERQSTTAENKSSKTDFHMPVE